jgi:hypothetical protein
MAADRDIAFPVLQARDIAAPAVGEGAMAVSFVHKHIARPAVVAV